MVKLRGPMFSLGASGKLGNTLVFATNRGVAYARELVIPANPKSGAQLGVRAMVSFLSQNWAALSAANKATWQTRATALNSAPFNGYMQYNQRNWRNFLGPSKEEPATRAGTPAVWAGASATASERQITVSKAITTANDNWGLCIHKELTTGFTPAWDNVVAIILAASVATFTWIDTPLVADTYYYNFSDLTDDGLRSLEDDEVNAVIS